MHHSTVCLLFFHLDQAQHTRALLKDLKDLSPSLRKNSDWSNDMKNRNGQAIADVLSKVAHAIRQLDESEIKTLLAGDFCVELVLENQEHRRSKNSKSLDADAQTVISEVAQLLGDLDDREQGRILLEHRLPKKQLLTHLARHLEGTGGHGGHSEPPADCARRREYAQQCKSVAWRYSLSNALSTHPYGSRDIQR